MQQLPLIVKAYQLPDSRKATIQILNSFLPFLAIWVAMYLLLDVSVWLISKTETSNQNSCAVFDSGLTR